MRPQVEATTYSPVWQFPTGMELRRLTRLITFAGCLAMIFLELTASAPRVEFLRSLGAKEFHFGVLGAIPPATLCFQFISAMFIGRLRRRKAIWITLMTLHRAVLLPFAFLPWMFPEADALGLVWWLIALLAFSEMLSNCSVPMWFSWMGELLPHGKINEFWAERRRWAALTTAACMLLSAEFFRRMGNLDIRLTYSAIATLGTLAGILDILLFIKVPEPPSAVTAEPLHLRFLIEPFKDPNFRGMLAYSGFFTFAIMFAAPFFQLYVLKELLLPVDVVLMLWFCHAVGGMIFSRHIGRLADRVGQRPVIILCTALKSLIVLGFFLIRPGPWMLMLIPIFLFDNMLNTGLLVARNGYMLKQSPPEHRPMYVAAVLAGSGLCGASASLLAGQLFRSMEGFRTEWWGFSLTPYHVVFGISFLLRSCSVFTALWIREPSGRATAEVLFEHIVPAFLRWLSFPLGFFNRRDP